MFSSTAIQFSNYAKDFLFPTVAFFPLCVLKSAHYQFFPAIEVQLLYWPLKIGHWSTSTSQHQDLLPAYYTGLHWLNRSPYYFWASTAEQSSIPSICFRFWWYLWYQAVTAMFFYIEPFHHLANQQRILHCTVFPFILTLLFEGTCYSTDIPMARKTSSRQPDISLLMLSSMSLPEIFWYSWNTEGRQYNCIISNAIHLNIRHLFLIAKLMPPCEPKTKSVSKIQILRLLQLI